MSCRSLAVGRIVLRKSLVPPAAHCPWIALKFFITCTFCAAIGQRQKIAQRQAPQWEYGSAGAVGSPRSLWKLWIFLSMARRSLSTRSHPI